MSQTQDLLVCLRNRDFHGLGEWISSLLELTKDDALLAKTGKMLYDGVLLVPLLQTGDIEASKALLGNPLVRSAMQSKNIEHDRWILDIAQKDTFAWLWALEQGWGELVEPRPSVLKNMTIVSARKSIDAYLADPDKVMADKLDIQRGKDAWDNWLRLASKRNPWLIGYIYSPHRDELEHMVKCNQQVSFPLHFWQNIESMYPQARETRDIAKSTYAGLGISYGAAEEKAVLAKLLGMTAQVADSISMEFEPAL